MKRAAVATAMAHAAEAAVRKTPRRTALATTGTLSHTLYAEVRKRLQSGAIGPHDRVLDYELAQEFECTRMPVRQALLRLVSDGYLVGTTRGFIVPTLTGDDVREIFEVRRLLEPDAAAGTVSRLTAAQLTALTRAQKKAMRAQARCDVALMIEANVQFRTSWLGAVSNHRLRDTIQRFADHAQQVRLGTLTDPATQGIVVSGMKALADSFVDRDAQRVKQAMLEFIGHAERQYFALLADDSGAAAGPSTDAARAELESA